MKLFTKKDRSTFPYWFAHWAAYQMTATLCNAWKPKYLFHDFEKPFLMLLWKDYKRVQKFHREHNRHHLSYKGGNTLDYEAIVIDWECSRFTKESSPLTALETAEKYFKECKLGIRDYNEIKKVIKKFKLDK